MFHFALESLLQHRLLLEEQRQIELAEARKRLNQEEAIKRMLEKSIQQVAATFSKKAHEGLPPAESVLYYRYLDQQRKRLEQVIQRTVLFGQHVVRARQKLVETRKNRKMIENLKQKKRDLYEQNIRKKEQEFINEVAAQRYIRGNSA
jgi:flagellar FliJ protein